MIEISLVGPCALPGGACSEAHRNFRGDGNGNVCILMGVFLVSAVVLVYGIVDLRFVVCFTVCMVYFSKKKPQEWKHWKILAETVWCSETHLWTPVWEAGLFSPEQEPVLQASPLSLLTLQVLCGCPRSQSLWQVSGLGLCRRIRWWKRRGSVLNTLLTRGIAKRLLLPRC